MTALATTYRRLCLRAFPGVELFIAAIHLSNRELLRRFK